MSNKKAVLYLFFMPLLPYTSYDWVHMLPNTKGKKKGEKGERVGRWWQWRRRWMKKLPFLVPLLCQSNVNKSACLLQSSVHFLNHRFLEQTPESPSQKLPTASPRCVCLVKTPSIAQVWAKLDKAFHIISSSKQPPKVGNNLPIYRQWSQVSEKLRPCSKSSLSKLYSVSKYRPARSVAPRQGAGWHLWWNPVIQVLPGTS